jgi:histone-lysine N-methyltransferase SETMAR
MSTNLGKIRDRTIIEVLFKLKYTLGDMIKIIPSLYPKDGPSRNTISKIFESLTAETFSYLDPAPIGLKSDAHLVKKVRRYINLHLFDGLRKIAKVLGSNKDSIRDIIGNELKMTRLKLKWIPYSLTDEQKDARVKIATQMLTILREDEKSDFCHILTGDETWLLYETSNDSMWVHEEETVETRVRPAIASKKQTLVVFWGLDIIPVFCLLGKGTTMNARTFQTSSLIPFKQYVKDSWSEEEPIYVHMDNAPAHKAKTTKKAFEETPNMKEMPQPPYSPDIAPCDFFLFGYLKNRLKNYVINNSEELFNITLEIMTEIPRQTRLNVFHEWIFRLETVIKYKGEYF